jgi:hypothetical protein
VVKARNEHLDCDLIGDYIARSPIHVPRRSCRAVAMHLPAGFEAVDIAVLDWIATEARRMARFVRM